MIIMRMFSYLVVGTVALSIYGLFTIKDKVSSLHYQIQTVSKQLTEEKNKLHILKAEQAYLTAPARLKALSSLYLQLDTVKIAQMTRDPLAHEVNKPFETEHRDLLYLTKSNSKWRYKTNYNNKYIKTISNR